MTRERDPLPLIEVPVLVFCNSVTMATDEKKGEIGSYAKVSDPADKQRKTQETAEKEPPLCIHIEATVSCFIH